MMRFLEAIVPELALVEREPVWLKFIVDKYKTQEICEKAAEVKG